MTGRLDVTLGQFEALKPADPRKAGALREYFFNADRPSGYALDQKYGLGPQYTVRAATTMVSKVNAARELVNA